MIKALLSIAGIFLLSTSYSQTYQDELVETAGIRDVIEIENLSPNPVESVLSVHIDGHYNIENLEIKIFNVIGRVLMTVEVKEKALVEIPFQELKPGPYILSLYNKGTLCDSRKILKK